MARTVGIGLQSFEKIRENNCFYVDKTGFIKEWWENRDDVTLITRPRRFGKTLMMNTVEQFFSVECAGCGKLFEGLEMAFRHPLPRPRQTATGHYRRGGVRRTPGQDVSGMELPISERVLSFQSLLTRECVSRSFQRSPTPR